MTPTVDLTLKLAENSEAAKAELEKKRLHLAQRPRWDLPRLALRITELSDADLMELYMKFTRYQDYIAGLHVTYEIDESRIETLLEVAKAKHLAKGWTGASTDRVAVAKAEATLDPDVRKYDDALLQIKAKRKMYGVLVDQMARDAGVVSREITRRTAGSSSSGRADRFTP